MKRATRKRRYILEEEGTNRYASLEMAQAAALPFVAEAVVEAILSGIEEGYFIVQKEGEQNVVRLAEP